MSEDEVNVDGVVLKDSDFRFFCIAFGNLFMAAIGFFGIAMLLVPCLIRLFLLLSRKGETREARKQIATGKKAAWIVLLLSAAFSFGMNYYGIKNAEDITVKKYSINLFESVSIMALQLSRLSYTEFARSTVIIDSSGQ